MWETNRRPERIEWLPNSSNELYQCRGSSCALDHRIMLLADVRIGVRIWAGVSLNGQRAADQCL
jgi:hypothetical protein